MKKHSQKLNLSLKFWLCSCLDSEWKVHPWDLYKPVQSLWKENVRIRGFAKDNRFCFSSYHLTTFHWTVSISNCYQWHLIKSAGVLSVLMLHPLSKRHCFFRMDLVYLCGIFSSLPGERRKIEKIIKLNTAAITRRAMKIPRQFLLSGETATSSWKEIKRTF